MCGIIGHVGAGDTRGILLGGLYNLEYRGYDSAGLALANGHLQVVKTAGDIEALEDAVVESDPTGTLGIGHTRWSTHGPPTDVNAHPHTDAEGRVAVVHNGIIENYRELRAELETDGYRFYSDTDTEVVPHLIARELDRGHDGEGGADSVGEGGADSVGEGGDDSVGEGGDERVGEGERARNRDGDRDPAAAVRAAVSRLEGSFALAILLAGTGTVYATRRDSPLVVGIGDDAAYLASDVPAFLEHTDRVIYLEDGQFATLAGDGSVTIEDADGRPVDPTVDTVEWDVEDTAKSGYEHFMLKEIHEQPTALRQCTAGRIEERTASVSLPELEALLEGTGRGEHSRLPPVDLVAAGTSYHASLYGARLLRSIGQPATAWLASEYAVEDAAVGERLVVGVTQSGETADTLAALRAARGRGAETLAITNVVGSTAARECDHVLYIRSGPEIGVAATKTFSAQLVALLLLTERCGASLPGLERPGSREDTRQRLAALRDLPGALQEVLDTTTALAVAEEYADSDAYFFVGRGQNYPVALEGALKCKEITYAHAEGFAAGELKHGPLALVTANTPVLAIVTGDDAAAHKTLGNVKEVEARDAPVVAVTDGRTEVDAYADHVLSIPDVHPTVAPILANAQLQLFAYHLADLMGRSIDKPRNLAKSVTVE